TRSARNTEMILMSVRLSIFIPFLSLRLDCFFHSVFVTYIVLPFVPSDTSSDAHTPCKPPSRLRLSDGTRADEPVSHIQNKARISADCFAAIAPWSSSSLSLAIDFLQVL